MTDREPIEDPLARFMIGLLNERMLQHAVHQIFIVDDNCAVGSISHDASEPNRHHILFSSFVSSMPQSSRWDSHPIRVGNQRASIHEALCCTKKQQRKPQCPIRQTSFNDDVEVDGISYLNPEDISRRKLELQMSPPRRPARESSIKGRAPFTDFTFLKLAEDNSSSSRSFPPTGSSSLNALLINSRPSQRGNVTRLSSTAHADCDLDLNATKIQSDRFCRKLHAKSVFPVVVDDDEQDVQSKCSPSETECHLLASSDSR